MVFRQVLPERNRRAVNKVNKQKTNLTSWFFVYFQSWRLDYVVVARMLSRLELIPSAPVVSRLRIESLQRAWIMLYIVYLLQKPHTICIGPSPIPCRVSNLYICIYNVPISICKSTILKNCCYLYVVCDKFNLPAKPKKEFSLMIIRS